MGNLLRRAWVRLWGSGLLMAAVVWGVFGLFSYYLPSRVLAGPWQQRIYDIQHLDIGTLRLLLVTAGQNAFFPILVVLFVARLCLNPIVDAFVYCRLGRSSQLLWKQFARLYVMLYLGLILLGWLFFLSAGSLLQLITLHPFLFLLGAFCIVFCFTLWFALYRARLVVEARSWPNILVWLQVALARLLLMSVTTVVSLWLQRWAMNLSGLSLPMVLCLAELLFIWARLWQASCAVEAAASKARWGSFSGSA